MAKKAPSKHSRAARRATSPGIDTDKSLKQVKPPPESINFRPAVLGLHHAAGVTKKSKQGRKALVSAKARRRQEKVLDRAEAIGEKTARKVERSKSQARAIQTRRKAWDDINKLSGHKQQGDKSEGKRRDPAQEAVDDFYDTDEEMEEVVEEREVVEAVAAVSIVPAAVPIAGSAGDDEEIL